MFKYLFLFVKVLYVFLVLFQPTNSNMNHAPPFTLPPPPQFPGQHSHPGGGYPAAAGPPPLPSQPPNAMSGSLPPHLPTHPSAGSVPQVGFYDPQNAQNTAVRICSFQSNLYHAPKTGTICSASHLQVSGPGRFVVQTPLINLISSVIRIFIWPCNLNLQGTANSTSYRRYVLRTLNS